MGRLVIVIVLFVLSGCTQFEEVPSELREGGGGGGNGPSAACIEYCGEFFGGICTNFADDYFDGEQNCFSECASIPSDANADDSTYSGNSIECRLNHINPEFGGMDPGTHCPHAAPDAEFGGCIVSVCETFCIGQQENGCLLNQRDCEADCKTFEPECVDEINRAEDFCSGEAFISCLPLPEVDGSDEN